MVTYSSDLFLDIFCVYTHSSNAIGLIFHAKLTVFFISNKLFPGNFVFFLKSRLLSSHACYLIWAMAKKVCLLVVPD